MQLSTTGTVNEFIHFYYVPRLIKAIKDLNSEKLEKICKIVTDKIVDGGRFFAFGNGGSEAIAGITIQLLQRVIPKSFQFDIYYPPIECELINNTNAKAFNEKIRRSGRKGDIVFLISASGNSQNINLVSALCRKKGITTISFSGNGNIVRGKNKATFNIVLNIEDQQVLEDATLGIINLLAISVKNRLKNSRIDVNRARSSYISALVKGIESFDFNKLDFLVYDLISAYKNGYIIRIDAPDSGLLSFCAKHLEHNLKWDSLSNISKRPTNKVFSSIPSCHFSGVANDGGDGHNHAIEIEDNIFTNDVEIIFTKSLKSRATRTAVSAAEKKKCKLHVFTFSTKSELIKTNIAQLVLHITARILNSRLLLIQKNIRSSDFERQLKSDLALLREKKRTIAKLNATN